MGQRHLPLDGRWRRMRSAAAHRRPGSDRFTGSWRTRVEVRGGAPLTTVYCDEKSRFVRARMERSERLGGAEEERREHDTAPCGSKPPSQGLGQASAGGLGLVLVLLAVLLPLATAGDISCQGIRYIYFNKGLDTSDIPRSPQQGGSSMPFLSFYSSSSLLSFSFPRPFSRG